MSKKKRPAGGKIPAWAWILAVAVVLIIAAAVILSTLSGAADPQNTDPSRSTGTATGNFDPVSTQPTIVIDDVQDVGITLGKGLKITDIGSYTGLYMEGGKDEYVSRVLMIVVTNIGTQTVQYAEIQLTDGEKTANFSLSTLPPGESLVALELNQMSYADGKDLTQASTKNVAMFASEPTLSQDKIKIQALDGVLNVTNISGEDITGDIVIYYKHAASDMLYGGITYRISITGGLKADEIRQLTAGHFTTSGSRVMWVTVG